MIFKLFVEGQEVVTDKGEYFEIVKGSVISGDFGTINREFSTNITLPAVSKNIGIFKAHKLWGGTSNVMNGVAHFGHEAFECLVQLVSFDEKKITIYIVKSSLDFKKIAGKTYKDLLMMGGVDSSSVAITKTLKTANRDFVQSKGVHISANHVATPSIPQLFTKAGLSSLFTWTDLNTVVISQNRAREVFKPFVSSGVYSLTMQSGGVQNIVTNVLNFSDAVGSVYPGLEVTETTINRVGVDLDTNSPPYNKMFVEMEWLGTPPTVDTSLTFQYRWGGVVRDSVGFNVRYLNIASKVMTLDSQPSELRVAVSGGNLSNAQVRISIMFWVFIDDEEPTSYGIEPILSGTGDIGIMEMLKGLALERGKYLTIKNNRLTFQSFPNIDDMAVVDMGAYYYQFKKTSLKNNSSLKAVNNYIQYSPNERGDYDRINIKIDNQGLKELEAESVLYTLPFANDRIYDKNHDINIISTNAPRVLKNALPKFQIFRDTFNNVILYTVEFKNLQEIPEEIMYIPQLNGLFVAEKIIKTSKNKVVVNCYKIQKQ